MAGLKVTNKPTAQTAIACTDLFSMYHIYQTNDEKPHALEGTMCPCEPRVEWNDPGTGEAYAEALVIHNAFDCREIIEEAERILENAYSLDSRSHNEKP